MARYPLEPLCSLREAAVTEGARTVGEQAQRTREAERQLAHAERALNHRETEHRAVRAEEHQRLEAGEARVGDLVAESAWGAAATRVEGTLRQRTRDGARGLAEQRRVEASARRELYARRAAAQIVERHRRAYDAEVERRAELQREEEASEVWVNGRRRSSRK